MNVNQRYPGTYSDDHGLEVIEITNDGDELRLKVRGVEFYGSDFDGLEPEESTAPALLEQFTLNHRDLCGCELSWEMPIVIIEQEHELLGRLEITLSLGAPAPNGGIDHEELSITLCYGEHRVESVGGSGWFEDALVSIASQLPNSASMKSCFGCLYADYSPYGSGLFGSMMCFEGARAEYLAVRSKSDFLALHDRYTRIVQETFSCPSFTKRIRGTGYRG